MKERIRLIFKQFYSILKKPEMRVLPGQLAFYFLMSLIPIFAIAIIIASNLITNFNFNNLTYIPQIILDILTSVVETANVYNNLAILLVIYLILGSNGATSIIITSNTLYGINNPGGIHTKVKSIIMTIVIVALLLFIIFIPAFGDYIIKYIFSIATNKEYLIIYMPIYRILKLIISFLIIFLGVNLIYILAPDKKIKGKKTFFGALFTTVGWIFVTELFGFYVTSVANYNALYGNFANILVLLMWVYLLAYLFVFGMAININLSKFKINDSKRSGSV